MYKILIVEDEAIIRKGLVYGHDYASMDCVVIDEADDGQQAIDKIREHQPDIVIIDINLPLKNGLEVLEETQDERYSAIILSGYSDFKYAQKAIELKVVDYLTKPLDSSKLRVAIERAIQNQKDQVNLGQLESQKQDLINIKLFELNDMVSDDLVKEMIKYIQDNFSQKFSMVDVAKRLGYSETHLTNKFRENTGTTFNDYLNRYRISKAIEFMKTGVLDVSVLSTMTGYSSPQYMDKVFLKYIGVSMEQYEYYLSEND